MHATVPCIRISVVHTRGMIISLFIMQILNVTPWPYSIHVATAQSVSEESLREVGHSQNEVSVDDLHQQLQRTKGEPVRHAANDIDILEATQQRRPAQSTGPPTDKLEATDTDPTSPNQHLPAIENENTIGMRDRSGALQAQTAYQEPGGGDKENIIHESAVVARSADLDTHLDGADKLSVDDGSGASVETEIPKATWKPRKLTKKIPARGPRKLQPPQPPIPSPPPTSPQLPGKPPKPPLKPSAPPRAPGAPQAPPWPPPVSPPRLAPLPPVVGVYQTPPANGASQNEVLGDDEDVPPLPPWAPLTPASPSPPLPPSPPRSPRPPLPPPHPKNWHHIPAQPPNPPKPPHRPGKPVAPPPRPPAPPPTAPPPSPPPSPPPPSPPPHKVTQSEVRGLDEFKYMTVDDIEAFVNATAHSERLDSFVEVPVQKTRKMTKGVLMFALGTSQLQAAARAAQQLKSLPDSNFRGLPVFLATDEAGREMVDDALLPHFGKRKIFSDIRVIQDLQRLGISDMYDPDIWHCDEDAADKCTDRLVAAKAGFIAAAGQLPWNITFFMNPHSYVCTDAAFELLTEALQDHEVAFFSAGSLQSMESEAGLLMFQKASFPWHNPPNDGSHPYPDFSVFAVRKSPGTAALMDVWGKIFRWYVDQSERRGQVQVTPALWAAIWEVTAREEHLMRVKNDMPASINCQNPRALLTCDCNPSLGVGAGGAGRGAGGAGRLPSRCSVIVGRNISALHSRHPSTGTDLILGNFYTARGNEPAETYRDITHTRKVFVSMDIGTTVNLANDLIKNRIQRPESGMNGKAGGPVILEPGTRAEWDKVLPVDRRDDVYFQNMFNRNMYGTSAWGACEQSSNVPCLYYTSFTDPVERTIEEFRWCHGHEGGQLDDANNASRGVAAQCTGPRGWEYMKNLNMVDWAKERGNVMLESLLPLNQFHWPSHKQPSGAWDQALFKDPLVSPIGKRQRLNGYATRNDLLVVLHNLERWFAVVGISERYFDSLELFSYALTGLVFDRRMKNEVEERARKKGKSSPIPTSDRKQIEAALSLDLELYAAGKAMFEKQLRAFWFLLHQNATKAMPDVYSVLEVEHDRGSGHISQVIKELSSRWMPHLSPPEQPFCNFTDRTGAQLEDLFNSPGKHIRGCRVLAGPFDWSIHAAVSAVKFARTQQHAVVMIDEPIQRSLRALEHSLAATRHSVNRMRHTDLLQWLSVCDGHCTEASWAQRLCSTLSDPRACKLAGACAVYENHQTHILASTHHLDDHMCFTEAEGSKTQDTRRKKQDKLLQSAFQHLLLENTFVGLSEQPFLSACLLVYKMKFSKMFEECCSSEDAYTNNIAKCRFLFEDVTTKCTDGASCTGEYPAVPSFPRFDWTSSNLMNTTDAHQSPFLKDPVILAGLTAANSLDCQVYALAAQLFYARVRKMEEDTGVVFLRWNVAEFDSLLCREGRRSNATFFGLNYTDTTSKMAMELLPRNGPPKGCPAHARPLVRPQDVVNGIRERLEMGSPKVRLAMNASIVSKQRFDNGEHTDLDEVEAERKAREDLMAYLGATPM